MKNSKAVQLVVQLDSRGVDAGVAEVEKCLTGLEKAASSISGVMSKAFLQVEDVLTNVKISIKETMSMLTSATGADQIAPVNVDAILDGAYTSLALTDAQLLGHLWG